MLQRTIMTITTTIRVVGANLPHASFSGLCDLMILPSSFPDAHKLIPPAVLAYVDGKAEFLDLIEW